MSIWVVAGSRNVTNWAFVEEGLHNVAQTFGPPELVIHGNCHGVDKLAEEWARRQEIAVQAFDAKWTQYGKAAGPIRNQIMLELNPDIVIGFVAGESRGTRGILGASQKRGIRTVEFDLLSGTSHWQPPTPRRVGRGVVPVGQNPTLRPPPGSFQ
jgi:YspA, cpYpsA-related SLOG family